MIGREPKNCGDCGVAPGQQHEEDCDVERCLACGEQAFCHVDVDDETGVEYCGKTGEPIPTDKRQTWTGIWPGVVECQELGWFARWTIFYDFASGYTREPLPGEVPNTGESIPCGADHPHAHEDLNRLAMAAHAGEIVWSRELERFVLPAGVVS